VAIGLVSAGALGNLHDRLFRTMEVVGGVRHGVVDFIKIYYWPGKAWPTFNVADIALVVGVGLLLIYLSRHGDALDAKNTTAEDEATAEEAAQPSEP
jgi:signal peptidase II